MIDSNKLGFEKETLEAIKEAKENFNRMCRLEGLDFETWMNINIDIIREDFFKGFTEREKYIFGFGMVSAILGAKLNELGERC